MSVRFESRVPQVEAATKTNKRNTLNAIGLEFSGHAKALTPVEFGRLRSSITWAADGQRRTHREVATPSGQAVNYDVSAPANTVQVGTNVEYAIHVHENLRAYHAVGQAKFIEDAFRARRDRLETLVKLGMEGNLPTQEI